MLMWACDLIPGVSGGTIAFITWIYERLINGIKNVLHVRNLKTLFTGKMQKLWNDVDGSFLLVLFGGILSSVLLLSQVLETAIERSPELIWWFFLGLIIASIVIIFKREKIQLDHDMPFLVLWWIVASGIEMISAWNTDPIWRYIVLSASISISAMILPWISWSFLLLILWMYAPLLSAINERNLLFLWLFAWWALLGLAIFSRVIAYFLGQKRTQTMGILLGFMIGSLPVLRPWQNQSPAPSETNEKSEKELVLPKDYEKNSNEWFVLLLFLFGLIWGYKVFNKFDQLN